VDIDAGVEAMRTRIARNEWQALESDSLANCRRSDPHASAEIEAIDLDPYVADLARAIELASHEIDGSVAALYWEFDVDNGWASAFYLCRTYQSERAGDDEWAADFDPEDVVPGPAMPELASLLAGSWDRTESDVARNLYLVARTVAAFGRASATWSSAIPLCAGYHDQDVVFRIVSPAG
jgi:hypothetical protein